MSNRKLKVSAIALAGMMGITFYAGAQPFANSDSETVLVTSDRKAEVRMDSSYEASGVSNFDMTWDFKTGDIAGSGQGSTMGDDGSEMTMDGYMELGEGEVEGALDGLFSLFAADEQEAKEMSGFKGKFVLEGDHGGDVANYNLNGDMKVDLTESPDFEEIQELKKMDFKVNFDGSVKDIAYDVNFMLELDGSDPDLAQLSETFSFFKLNINDQPASAEGGVEVTNFKIEVAIPKSSPEAANIDMMGGFVGMAKGQLTQMGLQVEKFEFSSKEEGEDKIAVLDASLGGWRALLSQQAEAQLAYGAPKETEMVKKMMDAYMAMRFENFEFSMHPSGSTLNFVNKAKINHIDKLLYAAQEASEEMEKMENSGPSSDPGEALARVIGRVANSNSVEQLKTMAEAESRYKGDFEVKFDVKNDADVKDLNAQLTGNFNSTNIAKYNELAKQKGLPYSERSAVNLLLDMTPKTGEKSGSDMNFDLYFYQKGDYSGYLGTLAKSIGQEFGLSESSVDSIKNLANAKVKGVIETDSAAKTWNMKASGNSGDVSSIMKELAGKSEVEADPIALALRTKEEGDTQKSSFSSYYENFMPGKDGEAIKVALGLSGDAMVKDGAEATEVAFTPVKVEGEVSAPSKAKDLMASNRSKFSLNPVSVATDVPAGGGGGGGMNWLLVLAGVGVVGAAGAMALGKKSA